MPEEKSSNFLPLAAAKELTGDGIFCERPEDLGVDAALQAHSLLRALEKAVADRLDELREYLLEQAARGRATPTGGQALVTAQGRLTRSRRVSSAPDSAGLLELLEGAGIDLQEAFDEVRDYRPNPSKLERLVSLGRLRRDDVDRLYKVTWSLRVTPARHLQAQLSDAVRRLRAEGDSTDDE